MCPAKDVFAEQAEMCIQAMTIFRVVVIRLQGKIFVRVLEDVGVYKCTDEDGREAFRHFSNVIFVFIKRYLHNLFAIIR